MSVDLFAGAVADGGETSRLLQCAVELGLEINAVPEVEERHQ